MVTRRGQYIESNYNIFRRRGVAKGGERKSNSRFNQSLLAGSKQHIPCPTLTVREGRLSRLNPLGYDHIKVRWTIRALMVCDVNLMPPHIATKY